MTARRWKTCSTIAAALALTIVLYAWAPHPDRAPDLLFTRYGSIAVLAVSLAAVLALALADRAGHRLRRVLLNTVTTLVLPVALLAVICKGTSEGPADTAAGWLLTFTWMAMANIAWSAWSIILRAARQARTAVAQDRRSISSE